MADAVAAARAWLADPGSLPEPRLSALGIADLNPANVLWDGSGAGWSTSRTAGSATRRTSSPTTSSTSAAGSPGVYDAAALVAAVGLDGRARERMAAYRPLWAAFWLAMLLPGNGGWRRNPPGTTEAQARHLLGLLEG